MNIQTKLHEEIADKLERLNTMNPEDEDYKATTDALTKLIDRAIEMEKLEIEHEEKLQQMEEDRKDRFVKNCLQGAGIIIPVGVTIWGALYSWKWERTDTITSLPGREFIKSILHLKK